MANKSNRSPVHPGKGGPRVRLSRQPETFHQEASDKEKPDSGKRPAKPKEQKVKKPSRP
jgi:hypothetical protein